MRIGEIKMATPHGSDEKKLQAQPYQLSEPELKKSNVPDEFLDPITKKPMQDPVVAADGYSYERTAIKEWILKKKLISPKTGEALKSPALITNHTLRALFAYPIAQLKPDTALNQDYEIAVPLWLQTLETAIQPSSLEQQQLSPEKKFEILKQENKKLQDTIGKILQEMLQLQKEVKEQKLTEIEPPNEFLCPIIIELMTDPTIAADGHTYDNKNITRWFKDRGKCTSPKTNKEIDFILYPNRNLLSLIQGYSALIAQREKNIKAYKKLAAYIPQCIKILKENIQLTTQEPKPITEKIPDELEKENNRLLAIITKINMELRIIYEEKMPAEQKARIALERELTGYQQKLQKNPEDVTVLEKARDVLFALKRNGEARELHKKVLAIKLFEAPILTQMGKKHFELNQFRDSLRCFDESLKIHANDPETLSLRGKTLVALKQYEKAISSYKESLFRRPNHPETLYNLGVALRLVEHNQEAPAIFNKCLELRPDDSNSLKERKNL